MNDQHLRDLDAEYLRVRKEQKLKLRKKIALVLIGAGVVIIGGILLAMTLMKSSDAYTAAENYLMADPQIQAETGGIKDFGMFPSGNVNIHNGYGMSELSIHVNGTKKDIEITVHLEKQPGGDWEVIDVERE